MRRRTDTGRRYHVAEAENEGFEAREIAGWPCSAIAGRLGELFHRDGGSPHLLDEVVAFRAFALALCEHLAQERLTPDWLFTKHRWLLWEDPDDWS
ncbi:hypothetical protein AB0K16_42370 [Nonomuraea jabiensis]|uniref:hypothetical protein n=1 Tax=Nonomuraea jabiensis TaxID=882448 RepID=UPI0034264D2E